MKSAIKTAIASFGMSGQVFHGPFLKTNPGYLVTSVLERAKRLSQKMFPDAKIVNNYDNLLNDNEIELIVVNTPDKLHFEMALAALNAGKHVIVEKPVTLKSAEAEFLTDIARKKNKILAVYQNRRWDGDFLTVQQVLKSGKLGRLVEFESHYDRYRPTIAPDTWKEEGGEFSGVLYNLGSHMVDQACVLFGKPKAVTAHLKKVRNSSRVTDYYDIRLEYDTFSALLKCNYLVHTQGPRYILHGENGSFYKSGIDLQEELLKSGKLPDGANWGSEPQTQWGTLYYSENGLAFEEKIETIQGNYHGFYNNVFEAIRNGAELLVKPEEAIEVLKILEACIISNSDRKSVFL